MPASFAVRPARPDDVPSLVAMVRELAAYERAEDQVQTTDEALHGALFGPFGPEGGPFVSALVADSGDRLVGMAVYFVSFSTWTGRHGIYLEDIYVRPDVRRGGVGSALLRALAGEVVSRGFTRLEWSVLDWNSPAIEFYKACGAFGLEEWTTFRLAGEALRAMASGAAI